MSLQLSASLEITGSINLSGSFYSTQILQTTSSYSLNSLTSSYIATNNISASVITASVITASIVNATLSGSHFGTSSVALLAVTASYFSGSITNATSASYSLTSSYAIQKDSFWTTKGDLAVGVTSNSSSKLSIGKNYEILMADTSSTLGLKWAPVNTLLPFGKYAYGTRVITGNNTIKELGFIYAENLSSSSFTSVTSTNPNHRTLFTSTTINTDAYIQINGTQDAPIFGKYLVFSGVFGLTTLTNVRCYLGLSSGNLLSSDTAPAHTLTFRYSTSIGDTTWHAVVKDSTTSQDINTGVTVDTNFHYFLMIYDANASEARFYIDNILKATHTLNLPVVGNSGFGAWGIRNLTGSLSPGFKYSNLLVQYDQV